jgi:hypothetical protein
MGPEQPPGREDTTGTLPILFRGSPPFWRTHPKRRSRHRGEAPSDLSRSFHEPGLSRPLDIKGICYSVLYRSLGARELNPARWPAEGDGGTSIPLHPERPPGAVP